MGMGTAAQRRLVKKFFDPFFNWDDDGKLREWLRQQDPDELEQFLNWFNFNSRRDRKTLGFQELAKLRSAPKDVLILKPALWGVGMDFNEAWRRFRVWWRRRRPISKPVASLEFDPYQIGKLVGTRGRHLFSQHRFVARPLEGFAVQLHEPVDQVLDAHAAQPGHFGIKHLIHGAHSICAESARNELRRQSKSEGRSREGRVRV
jgi:hypothetical protein